MNKHYVEKEKYLHIENPQTGVEKKSKNAQINRNTTHTHRLRLIFRAVYRYDIMSIKIVIVFYESRAIPTKCL